MRSGFNVMNFFIFFLRSFKSNRGWLITAYLFIKILNKSVLRTINKKELGNHDSVLSVSHFFTDIDLNKFC
jgi:hypothetical protein